MRAVVQRVSRAEVRVDGEGVAAIDRGLLVLVGVGRGDTERDAAALGAKVGGLRIFTDPDGRMNLSAAEVGGAAIVVSQFTLLADVRKGRRPSFTDAADPDVAAPLVDAVAAAIEESGVPTSTGRFGAHMDVDFVNDGPVTIVIEVSDGAIS